MSRVLVNIRGCNGAGKSTIPLAMMNDPATWVWDIVGDKGKRRCSFTVFPSYGWIALGTYFNKTGGLDTIRDKETIKECLFAALDAFPEYDVLMEGILASTTFSSYAELFKQVEKRYPDTRVLVFSMMPPADVAIKRVYQRNGGRPIKEELIRAKWGMVFRSHYKFKVAGFTAIRVDTSKIPKDRMLKAFLKTVNKHREDI